MFVPASLEEKKAPREKDRQTHRQDGRGRKEGRRSKISKGKKKQQLKNNAAEEQDVQVRSPGSTGVGGGGMTQPVCSLHFQPATVRERRLSRNLNHEKKHIWRRARATVVVVGGGEEAGADKRASVGRKRDFQEVKEHWRRADGARLNLYWDDFI